MSDFADAVAAYGAVVATAVASIQIRQMLRARPSLEIAIAPADEQEGPVCEADFVVSALNTGSVPIKVVRAQLATKRVIVWDYELPDEDPPLAPTTAWRKVIRGRDLAARLRAAHPGGTVAFLTVSASSGRSWKLDLRRIWSQFPEELPGDTARSARWPLSSRLLGRGRKRGSDGQ